MAALPCYGPAHHACGPALAVDVCRGLGRRAGARAVSTSKKPPAKVKPERETNPSVLKQALLRRFDRRITGQGEIELPCIPSMLDPYMTKLEGLWKIIGKPFSEEELAELRKALEKELMNGYRASVYSRLSVRFQTHRPPHPGIQYVISAKVLKLQDVYT